MVKPHASVKPKKSRDKFFGIREEVNDRWREVGGEGETKRKQTAMAARDWQQSGCHFVVDLFRYR